MTEEEELVDLIRQKLYHRNEAQAIRIIEQYKADIIKKTKEQLTIPNVRQQRELLTAFREHHRKAGFEFCELSEKERIETFLAVYSG